MGIEWTTGLGLGLPLLGTTAGAAAVFFMRAHITARTRRALSGFAAGVMTAASVWSLLVPAIDRSAGYGALSFLPAAGGLLAGVLVMIWLDTLCARGTRGKDDMRMLFWAVTIHNVPEGMAVGVVLSALMAGGGDGVTEASAIALALGIALQNFPEGAILSMPMHSGGMKKRRAFWMGLLSGLAETAGALFALAVASLTRGVLPYALAFAAGAMIYVVIMELTPEMKRGGQGYDGMAWMGLGFALMMSLDVALS